MITSLRSSTTNNETTDRCAQTIQQLQTIATTTATAATTATTQIDRLDVTLSGNSISVKDYVSQQQQQPQQQPQPQPQPLLNITWSPQQQQQHQHLEFIRIIRQITNMLHQNLPTLAHFSLSSKAIPKALPPHFWKGITSNRFINQLHLQRLIIHSGPHFRGLIPNTALESLAVLSCTFRDKSFVDFCGGIQSSRIKRLTIRSPTLNTQDSLASLWSALKQGATYLNSVCIGLPHNTDVPAVDGFESFLTNNTTVKDIHLDGFLNHPDSAHFIGALGRALATNTTVKQLRLSEERRLRHGLSEKDLIQTLFVEGLDQNTSVDSIDIQFRTGGIQVFDVLVDGLERMMMNRVIRTTSDRQDREDRTNILKKVCFGMSGTVDDMIVGLNGILDRLGRDNSIPIEQVYVEAWTDHGCIPPTVLHLDRIRSTHVMMRSLVVKFREYGQDDTVYTELADAMEENESLTEITIGSMDFHHAEYLLSNPNRYRIRCKCRRNDIQMDKLRRGNDSTVMPLVLAKLLMDDKPTDSNDREKIEARKLVDHNMVFELLKDMPGLFVASGGTNR